MKKKIFLGMPSATGFPYPDVLINIYEQIIPDGWEVQFTKEQIIARRPIQKARNYLVEMFLRSKCDYLWFCDDDNPPSTDALMYLIEGAEKGLDVISSLVPLRHSGYMLNIVKDGKNITSIEKYDGLFEVDNKTGGFPYQFHFDKYILNKRTDEVELYTGQDELKGWHNVYENIGFEPVVKSKEVGEDLFFGKVAKSLGYKFFADTRSRCRHYNNTPELLSVKNI